MPDATVVISWIAAFVALWWVIDWLSLLQEGRRMPLRRGPLRVLADILPKLKRNKTFIVTLVSLWLIGAAVGAVSAYLILDGTPVPSPQTPPPRIAGPLTFTDTVPDLLAGELPEALPQLIPIPLGGVAAIVLAVLLLTGLIRIMLHPPREIGDNAARALKGAIVILGLHVLASGALVAIGDAYFRELQRPDAPWYGVWLLAPRAVIVAGVFLAPAWALLWRLVFEIARDGYWSFKSSLRSLSASWGPAFVLIVLSLPSMTLLDVSVFADPGLDGALNVVSAAIPVLLLLTPWAVVDRQAGLADALRRSWRLFRSRPIDVITFGLRFALLFAVLGGVVALFEPAVTAMAPTWYEPMTGVARSFLLLLQALILARLYVHLSEELAADDSCTDCNGNAPPANV